MNDSEIIEKIEEFNEFLSLGTVISDMVRWLGWVFIKGLAFIVDGLESVTDDVLLIKQFFQNPEIVTFVNTIRPFLYILLAFSLLYTGYLLIFQKKFDREGIAINLFIALIIIMVLANGMQKANDFTNDAITAINTTQLYEEGEGSLSENITSRNLTDLVEFDKKNWETTELEPPNTIPLSMISQISVTEKLDADRDELGLSSTGKEISEHKLTWLASEKELIELDDSTLMPWKNEYYYRYSIKWLTLIATLAVMAFTLFSIAYKLARLSFELTFNYILALVVAPADIHDGQKTKKIMQSILNTFLVIILIFLSMKIYMIGTAYIANELSGLAYLVALIGFSVAVVDGPNIVERLFGIDAGLKNGWGVLAGAYAGSKMLSGASNAVMNKVGGSGTGKDDADKLKNRQSKSGIANGKAMSPNDTEDGDGINAQGAIAAGINGGTGKGSGASENGKKIGSLNDNRIEDKNLEKAPSPNDVGDLPKENDAGTTDINAGQTDTTGSAAIGKAGSGASPNDQEGSISQQDLQSTDSENRIPSPNDSERENLSSQSSIMARNSGATGVPSPNDQDRPSAASQDNGNVFSLNGSQSVQGIRQSSTSINSDIENINDQSQGNTSVRDRSSGTIPSPNSPNSSSDFSPAGNSQTISGSNDVQRQQGVQNPSVRTDNEIESVTDQVQGNTTVRNNASNGSLPSSSNGVSTGNTSSAEGQNRSESSSGASSRQQNTANVTRSGGTNIVDENVNVNEIQGNSVQGSRNVNTSNSDGSSTTSGSDGLNRPDQSVSRSVNQNSTSRQSVQNETIINHQQNQQISQSEYTRENVRKRPRTYNVGQNDSSSLDRMKNYRRNR